LVSAPFLPYIHRTMKRSTAARRRISTMTTTRTRRAGMEESTKRRLRFLGGFAAYFIALWFLWDTPVVYPLKVFVVLLHELSHGIAAVAGGGSIQRILLDVNEGGACYCPGGNAFVTLTAGYLGSLAWGALLLVIATGKPKRHRVTLMTVGAILAIMTVLYVRTLFGIVFGVIAGLALVAAAKRLAPPINQAILTVLGLTSGLYAILDIKSDIIDRPGLRSDAAMLQELTGVPTLIWGFLWIGLALLVSALLFRRIYRNV
jgi:hypothetical protein